MMKALKAKPVARLLVAVIIMAAGSWGCASNKTPNWIRASAWPEIPSAKELHLQKESVSADMSTQKELPEMTCEEHERLGDVNFSRGNIGTAFVQYQKSLQLNPKNSIIHYKIGLLFVVCGMNEDAVGEFREVLKKESNHALSHEGLGLAFFQMKQYEDAEECFRNAAEHDPKLWKPHNFLGIINDYNGRHKAAVREYEAALALKPDNRVLYNNLGTSYLLAGDYEKAVNVFNNAIATKTAYSSIYNNLGLALSKIGRYQEALEAFRKGGDEAQAYNNVGCIYLQNGDYEKAIRCFEKAIELKPTFYTNARENLKKAVLARQLSLDSSLQTHFDGDHKKQKPRLKKDLGETRANPLASSKGEDRGNLDSILPEGKTDETEDQSPSSQKPQTEASEAAKPSAASGSKDTQGVALQGVKVVDGATPADSVETSLARGSLRPGARTLRVEKLKIWRESEGNPLKFRFKVRSVDPQARTIKGYTFVVLKPEKGCQEPATSFPQTLLKDGRPTLFQEGKAFNINRSGTKLMCGTFLSIETLEAFETATVYVYSESGILLAERVYEMDKVLFKAVYSIENLSAK